MLRKTLPNMVHAKGTATGSGGTDKAMALAHDGVDESPMVCVAAESFADGGVDAVLGTVGNGGGGCRDFVVVRAVAVCIRDVSYRIHAVAPV
jgi:hypothetical protein